MTDLPVTEKPNTEYHISPKVHVSVGKWPAKFSQDCICHIPHSVVNPSDKWNDWCFRPRFCNCKAILGWGQPGLMRWILLWIMPLVQDWSLNLLTSTPACYHCTTDAALNPSANATVWFMIIIKKRCYFGWFQHFKGEVIDIVAYNPKLTFWIIAVLIILLSTCCKIIRVQVLPNTVLWSYNYRWENLDRYLYIAGQIILPSGFAPVLYTLGPGVLNYDAIVAGECQTWQKHVMVFCSVTW